MCGGLLAGLAASGAQLEALFLSDGSGGEEAIEDRTAYAAVRRQEAEQAARLLGISSLDHLELPDGSLDRELGRMAEGIELAISSLQPDLILAPSPLEATTDHRASFAALYQVLSCLRSGHPLWSWAGQAQLLLYEVNHPGYPNLLVDVSGQVEKIAAAMACYGSQQERHDYLGAALGLRRFRALSLPSGVVAVEGFRRLRVDEVACSALSQLVREAGGEAHLVAIESGSVDFRRGPYLQSAAAAPPGPGQHRQQLGGDESRSCWSMMVASSPRYRSIIPSL